MSHKLVIALSCNIFFSLPKIFIKRACQIHHILIHSSAFIFLFLELSQIDETVQAERFYKMFEEQREDRSKI